MHNLFPMTAKMSKVLHGHHYCQFSLFQTSPESNLDSKNPAD